MPASSSMPPCSAALERKVSRRSMARQCAKKVLMKFSITIFVRLSELTMDSKIVPNPSIPPPSTSPIVLAPPALSAPKRSCVNARRCSKSAVLIQVSIMNLLIGIIGKNSFYKQSLGNYSTLCLFYQKMISCFLFNCMFTNLFLDS